MLTSFISTVRDHNSLQRANRRSFSYLNFQSPIYHLSLNFPISRTTYFKTILWVIVADSICEHERDARASGVAYTKLYAGFLFRLLFLAIHNVFHQVPKG